MNDVIELVDGTRFRILDPDPAAISPQVIAHALSHLCRFTGHTRTFYSVAQHCVLVSMLVPRRLSMEGLLHDASEAFIGDISSPLKWALGERVWEIENRVHTAIRQRFETRSIHHQDIKQADLVAMATEVRDLMPGKIADWDWLPDPIPGHITPWSPLRARKAWLDRFVELGGVLSPVGGELS